MWVVDFNGVVHDHDFRVWGKIDKEGEVFLAVGDEAGLTHFDQAGWFDPNGDVFDRNNDKVGNVDASGMIYAEPFGDAVASVQETGFVYRPPFRSVGSVHSLMNPRQASTGGIERYQLAAAAIVLLLRIPDASSPAPA